MSLCEWPLNSESHCPQNLPSPKRPSLLYSSCQALLPLISHKPSPKLEMSRPSEEQFLESMQTLTEPRPSMRFQLLRQGSEFSTESPWACGPPKPMKMREFFGALESVVWPELSRERSLDSLNLIEYLH